jgi:hypothetical protein
LYACWLSWLKAMKAAEVDAAGEEAVMGVLVGV